jgi:hypothetical protein
MDTSAEHSRVVGAFVLLPLGRGELALFRVGFADEGVLFLKALADLSIGILQQLRKDAYFPNG